MDLRRKKEKNIVSVMGVVSSCGASHLVHTIARKWTEWAKGRSRKAMTGLQLCEAALIADTAKVSTLLSRQGVQSFINYQGECGLTPLHCAA
jgi:hypothetical protein